MKIKAVYNANDCSLHRLIAKPQTIWVLTIVVDIKINIVALYIVDTLLTQVEIVGVNLKIDVIAQPEKIACKMLMKMAPRRHKVVGKQSTFLFWKISWWFHIACFL